MVAQIEKFPDCIQRKAELACVTDEGQPVKFGLAIAPLTAFCPPWLRHQAYLFIIADRLDFGASFLSQTANREHVYPQEATVLVDLSGFGAGHNSIHRRAKKSLSYRKYQLNL